MTRGPASADRSYVGTVEVRPKRSGPRDPAQEIRPKRSGQIFGNISGEPISPGVVDDFGTEPRQEEQ
jgi:hypothetical protein